MNLVVDIGNSRIKVAIFNHGELLINLLFDELSVENISILLGKYPTLNKVILTATRPYSPKLKIFFSEKFDVFIELNHQTPIPIDNLYKNPETLGKDRLAAAVGANKLFPNQNILIIDAGTAITYDVVNKNNQFLGGNISPGLTMRFKALNHFTGNLPLVKPDNVNIFLGKETTEAILCGVQNGILFEIEQNIETLDKIYNNLKVILTGGDIKFFDKKLKNSIFVHSNLILIGLNRILEFNN